MDSLKQLTAQLSTLLANPEPESIEWHEMVHITLNKIAAYIQPNHVENETKDYTGVL